MQYKTSSILSATTLLVANALAQTPPGSSPSTTDELSVSYGDTPVTAGVLLPRNTTLTPPTFTFTPSSAEQLYTLLFVDLSISTLQRDYSTLPPPQTPLALGIGPNRTTRLHFWQAGLSFTPDGSLVNNSEPVAIYNPPTPPGGDIAHIYSFYLFEQEDGFAAPPDDNPFSRSLVDASPLNRVSFNVERVAEEEGVGELVAANYIRVQNTTAAAPSSTPSGTGSPSATGSAVGPTTAPFEGEAGTIRMGGVVALVSAFAVGAAFLLT